MNRRKYLGIVFIFLLGIGMMTSCGNKIKQEELPDTKSEINITESENKIELNKEDSPIDRLDIIRNNYYNTYTSYYEGFLYVYDKTGIYRTPYNTNEWEIIYDKENIGRRGIEAWDGYLYFCDYDASLEIEDMLDVPSNNCIKRINMKNLEIEIVVENIFGYDIQFHEGNMYVKTGDSGTEGFALDNQGMVSSKLNETEEDYFYYEWNQYYATYMEAVGPDGDRSAFTTQSKEPIVDTVYMEKCVGGKKLYGTYQNEMLQNIMMYDPTSQEEIKICESLHNILMVTPEGIYYYENENMDIGYIDFTTLEYQKLYQRDTLYLDNFFTMSTFDKEYIYGIVSGSSADKTILTRLRRADGNYEEICEVPYLGSPHLLHSSLVGNHFFLEKREEGEIGIILQIINLDTKEIIDLSDVI